MFEKIDIENTNLSLYYNAIQFIFLKVKCIDILLLSQTIFTFLLRKTIMLAVMFT